MTDDTTPSLPAVLTASEAAAYLGISLSTTQRLLRQGDIPAFRVGRQWRILRAALDAWLSEPFNPTSSEQEERPVTEDQPVRLTVAEDVTDEAEIEFPRLLLEREVAKIFRLDPGTLSGQRRRGQLPGALGFALPTGDIRYDAAEVAAFITGLMANRPPTVTDICQPVRSAP